MRQPFGRNLGFTKEVEEPRQIIRALSWLISLAGPTVLALDQLDPIVSYMHLAVLELEGELVNEEVQRAKQIVEDLGVGLGSLFDMTRRTLVIVSCLETTWNKLDEMTLVPFRARYEPLRYLQRFSDPSLAKRILCNRLKSAYGRIGYTPRYPGWPFADRAFEGLQGVSPRELLQRAYAYQRAMLTKGEVTEITQLSHAEKGERISPKFDLQPLDSTFNRYCAGRPAAAQGSKAGGFSVRAFASDGVPMFG